MNIRHIQENSSISPSLLWEYDLSHFDWWKSRKIVVQRVIERGWLKDFYAAFNLYGGIEGFRGNNKKNSQAYLHET